MSESVVGMQVSLVLDVVVVSKRPALYRKWSRMEMALRSGGGKRARVLNLLSPPLTMPLDVHFANPTPVHFGVDNV